MSNTFPSPAVYALLQLQLSKLLVATLNSATMTDMPLAVRMSTMHMQCL